MSVTPAQVSDLARDLAGTFFDGRPPAAGLDDALADALEVLEAELDQVGENVGTAIYDLVVRLRWGRIDRASCRVIASRSLVHVADRIGADEVAGRFAPLCALLGALSTLPEGPERYERALDPAPDPGNAVEVALAKLVAQPDAPSGLRDALLAGPLYVPVLDLSVEGPSLALRFLPVVVRDTPMMSVFTDPERVSEHARAAGVGEVPLIEVEGRELASLCPPGHGVAINPGAVLGASLTEAEVRALG